MSSYIVRTITYFPECRESSLMWQEKSYRAAWLFRASQLSAQLTTGLAEK